MIAEEYSDDEGNFSSESEWDWYSHEDNEVYFVLKSECEFKKG